MPHCSSLKDFNKDIGERYLKILSIYFMLRVGRTFEDKMILMRKTLRFSLRFQLDFLNEASPSNSHTFRLDSMTYLEKELLMEFNSRI
jgi:hypothetical protein